jgi:hypothetical protein
MEYQLDSELESLLEIIKRQKEIANKMYNELELQNKLIPKITKIVDNKDKKITSLTKSIPISRTWYDWFKSWF